MNFRITNLKLIRHLAFFLAVIVLMGHDTIPHFHDDKHDSTEHSTTLPQQSTDDLTDLQNSFSNFQHPTAEHNLVYLSFSEKTTGFQKKIFHSAPCLFMMEYRAVWYANYKKQRFREYLAILSPYQLQYFSLRGPPSC
ncbi:hypothetical protein [Daejeonella sp.]|uniref:hypothetical protein n=1 Tax=Daejeonella sp. TaxID=2805397 RepID=UPI00398384BE